MARVLIVGGGRRGRLLGGALVARGDAVRITTRKEAGRAEIEALGAECWIGTPDRLATLRGALDRVAVACWLLGCASGSEEELTALFTTRLELFLTQAIDTTVRGVIYEAGGTVAPELLVGGEQRARTIAAANAIPLGVIGGAEDGDLEAWATATLDAIDVLLSGG